MKVIKINFRRDLVTRVIIFKKTINMQNYYPNSINV